MKAGKFLGFMISQRGIEANLKKMEAIINMEPHTTLNELQKLNGQITALGRFISCSMRKCLPFFWVIKNVKKFERNVDCHTSFKDIKRFLASPLLLSRPTLGEILYSYLSIGNESLASVPVRDDKGE